MQQTTNLTGLLLRAYDLRETSRMLDLFTRELGRLGVSAKGIRRNKSRFLPLSEPLVEARYNLQAGRSGYFLKDGELLHAHGGLRRSIDRLAVGSACADFVRNVLPEAEPAPEEYDLLAKLLLVLEEADREGASRLFGAFLLKLVSFLGYRPVLTRCIECGCRLTWGGAWEPASGGMRCKDHRALGEEVERLRPEAHRCLAFYIARPLQDIAEQPVEGAGAETNRRILRYFLLHTGTSLPKSAELLKKLGHL